MAGSLRLEVPKAGTRPTSDRVREAIFSTLSSWQLVEGMRVLDLYAGSGALGLEAASRGAQSVTLVEKHPQAAQVATKNSKTVLSGFAVGKEPSIEVVRASVQSYLESASRASQIDVALLDPPYDLAEDELAKNLESLVPILAEDAVVLVERSSRTPAPRWPRALAPLKERRYGETVLWWAELSPEGT